MPEEATCSIAGESHWPITLKVLTYTPAGSPFSLPETRDGIRNRNYQFCWLRAAFISALSSLWCESCCGKLQSCGGRCQGAHEHSVEFNVVLDFWPGVLRVVCR